MGISKQRKETDAQGDEIENLKERIKDNIFKGDFEKYAFDFFKKHSSRFKVIEENKEKTNQEYKMVIDERDQLKQENEKLLKENEKFRKEIASFKVVFK